jgi:tRNA(Leu) C34 or U34 (ribose-2'-O)-methylase TrmL
MNDAHCSNLNIHNHCILPVSLKLQRKNIVNDKLDNTNNSRLTIVRLIDSAEKHNSNVNSVSTTTKHKTKNTNYKLQTTKYKVQTDHNLIT